MVLCAADSEIAPTSRLVWSTRYLYQDSTLSTQTKVTLLEQDKDMQRSVAVKYLSLVPQHDAFAAGKMPVVLFNVDDTEGNTARSKQEAEEIICSLIKIQRPTLVLFPSPKEMSMEVIGADLLAAKMEFDQSERFPLAVDLDTHYFSQSESCIVYF